MVVADLMHADPIFHDTKKNKPRFVASFFPHKSYPFLYGSIPQTWESPHVKDNYTGFVGDNDPVDLFDISSISYVCPLARHSSVKLRHID